MSSPQDKLRRQLEQTPAMWGRGPVSYDYGRWVDNTHHILVTIFGEKSPQERAFLEIVGEGAEARGCRWPRPTPGECRRACAVARRTCRRCWALWRRLPRAQDHMAPI